MMTFGAGDLITRLYACPAQKSNPWEQQQEARHHKRAGPANREHVVHLPTLNNKIIRSSLNNQNTFTKETGSPNVKLVLTR